MRPTATGGNLARLRLPRKKGSPRLPPRAPTASRYPGTPRGLSKSPGAVPGGHTPDTTAARRAAACPPTRRPKAPQEARAGAGSPLPHAPSNALTCVWAQFPGGATRRGAEYVHARSHGWRHRPRSAPRPTPLPPPPCRPVPTGGAVPGARSPAGTSRALPPLSPVALSPCRPALRWRQAGCCLGLRWTPSPGPRVQAGARGGAAVPAPTHAPLHLPAAARLQLPRLAPPADSTAQRSHAGGGGKADWNTTEPRPTGRLLPQ